MTEPAFRPTDDIIDVDLSVTKKKKIRIDHDDSRILELNTSDMGIAGRITDTYPKLAELQEKASKIMDGIDEHKEDDIEGTLSDYRTISERLKEIDTEMRNLIDYMFDSNVSEVTAPSGSMYDLFNGTFRYEYIISVIMGIYEKNLQSEFKKIEKQMDKHTAKYTKG